MNTPESICQCGRPTGTATAMLCEHCRKTIEVALVNIAAYYADLDTIKTRLVRFGQGGKSSEHPLGMDARFAELGEGSEVEHDARNTIVAWVRYVNDHLPSSFGPTCDRYCLHTSCAYVRRTRFPLDTMPTMCRYLLKWSDWLRVGPVGDEVLDELTDLETRLRRLVDRPADRWYAGPCNALVPGPDGTDVECGTDLYALADLGGVTCRVCAAEYDVKARRDWLLAAAEEHEATATTIARAITVLGEDVRDEGKLAARIRQWASRNRIFAVRHEYVGGIERPLYRIRDVLNLLAEDMRHAEEKRLRKSSPMRVS